MFRDGLEEHKPSPQLSHRFLCTLISPCLSPRAAQGGLSLSPTSFAHAGKGLSKEGTLSTHLGRICPQCVPVKAMLLQTKGDELA